MGAKISLVLSLLLLSFSTSAQLGDALGNWFDREFSDFELFRENFTLDLTYNHLIGETNGVKQKISSNGFNFGILLNKRLFNKKDAHFLLGFGLRYSVNVFRNDGALTILDSLGATQMAVYEGIQSRSSYSFSHRFIELPLEFRLRHYGNEIKRFTVGVVFGVRTLIIEQARIGASPFFQANYPDVNVFRYGVLLRAGLKRIGIYAAYYINPIFKNPMSSKLNILNVGVNFAL